MQRKEKKGPDAPESIEQLATRVSINLLSEAAKVIRINVKMNRVLGTTDPLALPYSEAIFHTVYDMLISTNLFEQTRKDMYFEFDASVYDNGIEGSQPNMDIVSAFFECEFVGKYRKAWVIEQSGVPTAILIRLLEMHFDIEQRIHRIEEALEAQIDNRPCVYLPMFDLMNIKHLNDDGDLYNVLAEVFMKNTNAEPIEMAYAGYVAIMTIKNQAEGRGE